MIVKCLICGHELISVGVGKDRVFRCPIHGSRGLNQEAAQEAVVSEKEREELGGTENRS
jgi:hypothetical protein